MSAKRWWLISVAAAGLMSYGGTAIAQSDTLNRSPLTDVTGYASSEMRNIYRQNIGTNYTASRIIQSDLNRGRAGVPYVGQSVRTGAGLDLGLSSGPTSKPFSHVSPRPTVSPWMNLFRDDLSGESDLNYSTLVRPQLEQQRFNQQIERQNLELSRRIQAMSARGAYSPEGSSSLYPTGHPTVFMNYGHYYPALGRRR